MASRSLPSVAFLSSLLVPVSNASHRPSLALPILRGLRQSLLPQFPPIPTAAIATLPSLLGEIWDSVLRAVPKKKTSHMKKRHRQMAGKALKDVPELNRCSACGRAKRAHALCPYCVKSIFQFWKRQPSESITSKSAEIPLYLTNSKVSSEGEKA